MIELARLLLIIFHGSITHSAICPIIKMMADIMRNATSVRSSSLNLPPFRQNQTERAITMEYMRKAIMEMVSIS